MHPRKNSKGSVDKTLGTYFEFTPSEDSRERLLRALEMLLGDNDSGSLTGPIGVLELTQKEKKK